VRISGIDAGGARIAPVPGSTKLRPCQRLATVDGKPLELTIAGTLDQLTRGDTLPLRACPSSPPRLGAGDHRLQTAPGWLVDLLDLRSAPAGAAAAVVPPAPRTTVLSSSASRVTLSTEAAEGPYYLVLGQGYDPRWRGTIDGQPLGPPRVIDGYSVGWRISDRQPHRIAVDFGPQRWATASLVASLVALLVVLALLLVPWWRRAAATAGGAGSGGRPGDAPQAPPSAQGSGP
jgi:arabinofuranan 3-O-arabinosyltransferase